MSLEQDLANLAKLFEGRQAQLARQLAEAPASPMRDEVIKAVDSLKSQLATVLTGVKEAVLRHEQSAQAATEKIEAAKKKIAATAKAFQLAQLEKAAPPAVAAPKLSANGDALHARLRALLLDEFAPRGAHLGRPPESSSIGNEFPAFDESEMEAAALLQVRELALLRAVRVHAVTKPIEFSERASQVLHAEPTLHDGIAVLLQARLFPDVLSLLCGALPDREALWWGSLCVRLSLGEIQGSGEKAALRAAVAWVLDPSPKLRASALEAAGPIGEQSACGCLALAAAQTHASLAHASPDGGPTRSAFGYLFRALKLAGTRGRFAQKFVELGLDVAAGDFTWKRLVAVKGAGSKQPPLSPTLRESATLDGHALGKALLVELGLIKLRKPSTDSVTQADDFHWESSDEWNSLGM